MELSKCERLDAKCPRAAAFSKISVPPFLGFSRVGATMLLLRCAYRTFPLIKLRPNFVYSFSPTMAHLIMVCRGRVLGIKVKGLRHADL